MQTVELNSDNITDYAGVIPPDIAENIDRSCYHGIAVAGAGNKTAGGIIWKTFEIDDYGEEYASDIVWMNAADPDTGKAVLDVYTQIVRDSDVVRTSFELPCDEYETLIPVFKDKGFEISEGEGREIVVTVAKLKELKIASKLIKIPGYINSLSAISEKDFKRGLIDCLYYVKRTFESDMTQLPIDWYDGKISSFELTDGECAGFLLVHKCSTGKYRVELLADWGPKSNKDLMYMIGYSLRKAFDICPDDTAVSIRRRDDATNKLAAFLFPRVKGKRCILGTRTE